MSYPPVQLVVTMLLTLLLAVAVPFCMALLVGLIAPAATRPAFVFLSLGWLWMGWKYAVARDRAATRRAGREARDR